MSGILINDNSTAVEAYNNLDATSDMLSSAVNKLSSGLQIQTAADDPAGYLVGQYLQEESNGYGQSISNAQDAVSVLQTAQGALNQEASVLQTMNTLATEAANGGVQDASTSAAAQSEFASLQAELDRSPPARRTAPHRCSVEPTRERPSRSARTTAPTTRWLSPSPPQRRRRSPSTRLRSASERCLPPSQP
jgi:hypothetical protein